MNVRYLNPEHHPLPAGRFSHVSIAEAGRIAFIAGQVAVDADGVLQASDDVEGQFPVVFDNVMNIVRSLGAVPSDVLELTTYLVGNDAREPWLAARSAVYDRYFGDQPPPPNTLLIVSGLVDPAMRVEVSAVVRLPDTDRGR